MSASEDYPTLAKWGALGYIDGFMRYEPEAAKALQEIDALRADVANLLTRLAAVGAEWDTR